MVDFVKIHIKAGNGGHGAVSFFRTKQNPIGRPDGGDGGKGGDVYFEGSHDLTTLLDYNFNKAFRAPDGEPGGTNQRHGKNGEDMILKVPVGTLIKMEKSMSEVKDITVTAVSNLIGDITENGQRVLVLQGGHGGRGNQHLKSYHPGRDRQSLSSSKEGSWDRVRTSEPGVKGEEMEVSLELKLLANVGLVGEPNAGKSTLLTQLTKATPKIANYPFTTLEPNLGVMTYLDKSLVLADIPGLIEGASAGKGLGTQFLKHIARTKVLLHLISAEIPDLVGTYQTINKELSTYSVEMTTKPQLVVISKIDLADREELMSRVKKFPKSQKVMLISSFSGEGLEELQKVLLGYF